MREASQPASQPASEAGHKAHSPMACCREDRPEKEACPPQAPSPPSPPSPPAALVRRAVAVAGGGGDVGGELALAVLHAPHHRAAAGGVAGGARLAAGAATGVEKRAKLVAALLGEVAELAADLAGAAARVGARRALALGQREQALVGGDVGVEAAAGEDGLVRRGAARVLGLAAAAVGGRVDERLHARVRPRLLGDADHVLPHRVPLQRDAAPPRTPRGGGQSASCTCAGRQGCSRPALPTLFLTHLVRTRFWDALSTPRVRTVATMLDLPLGDWDSSSPTRSPAARVWC